MVNGVSVGQAEFELVADEVTSLARPVRQATLTVWVEKEYANRSPVHDGGSR